MKHILTIERPKIRKSWKGEMHPLTKIERDKKAYDRGERNNWKNEVKNHFSYEY